MYAPLPFTFKLGEGNFSQRTPHYATIEAGPEGPYSFVAAHVPVCSYCLTYMHSDARSVCGLR